MAVQEQKAQKPGLSGRKKPLEYFEAAKKFLREVRVETMKVTWATKEQTIAATTVVIFCVVCVAIYLAAWDTLFTYVFKWIGR